MFLFLLGVIIVYWVIFLCGTQTRDLPYEPYDSSLYDQDHIKK